MMGGPAGIGRGRIWQRVWRRLLPLVLILCLLSVSHSAPSVQAAPSPLQFGGPGDLVIATAGDISTLDPLMSTSSANIRVTFNLFDTLVTVGPDLSLEPALATSWRLIDDLTWEFTLRPGVTFHNGDPLTAHDVKFTISRTLDPSSRTAVSTVFSTVERIDVPDDLTVRFVTHEPDPLLPARLSFVGGQIIPERYYLSVGPERFGREPVGSGVIKFVAWAPNNFSLFSANTEYWGGAPDFERVAFVRMQRERDRVNSLIDGTAHIATSVPPEWRLRLSIRPEAQPLDVLYSGLYVLSVNVQSKPLDDPRVRQALSLAIDRETILRGLWLGRGQIPIGFVPQGDRIGYAPDLPPFAYDQEQAISLLQQAGYNGEPIIFEATDGYIENDAAMTTVLASMWQQVGLNVEIRWITLEERTEKNLSRGFDGVWWSDPTSTIQDPDGMMFRLLGPGGIQDYWQDAEWLQLGVQARTSQDAEIRSRNYRRMQEIMLDQLPWIPILQPEEGYGLRNEISWQPSATGRLELRAGSLRWSR
jgi:peptide/nickel transport system substrate-binding protein